MSQLTIVPHDREQIAQSLAAYLPGGPLWEAAQVPGTNLNALVLGLSGALLDAEGFNYLYNSRFIPDTDDTFLEEWERALGIPDSCFPGPDEADRDVRRRHVLIKLASLGVQTADDFEALAITLGFTGTIVQSGIDAGVAYPDGAFTVDVSFALTDRNRFPISFPIPFGDPQFSILECIFTKLKPANCAIQFGEI